MLRKELNRRKSQLEKYVKVCESYLAMAPKGRLQVSSSRGHRIYYQVWKNQSGGRRLLSPEKDIKLIKVLAQKDYYIKALREIRKELRLVNALLEYLDKNSLQSIPALLSETRRNLITPFEETIESKLIKWLELKSPPLVIEGDRNEENPHVTLNGEHVRSAAEKTIANALFKAGIPYKYEYPFRTADHRTLNPDFTIFNPHTGEIFRWEHLGMMERPKYVRDQLSKIDSYYGSGLFTGNGLILTFADSYQGIRQDLVERIITTLFS